MNRRSYRLDEIAHLVKGEYFGEKDVLVSSLASLEHAQENQISFVNGEKYLAQAESSQAGAYIVTAELKQLLTGKQNFIVVDNPYLAFATLTHIFEKKIVQRGIESTAQIHPSAIVADDVYIGHYAVIGENCVIGTNTIIQAHAFIDDGVEIGKDCFIDAHVTITGAARLKDRVRIHANTVIGTEGFGFAPYQGKWHRIAQLGSVRIGNDVRIGSNCSIDRGALDDTILEDGVIIDNLVQIAHNVHIGENTAIAANCGIAGSAHIGKNCILGGASGVVGHIKIADNVTLTAMSMATRNISEAGTYSSGMGLFENTHWKKTIVRLRQLADVPLTQITKRLDHMQAQLESLESTFKLRK
ncbi:UDP-3-O-(3-hydroxymyristoyl)glucosamine N-acyltransferase [Acinetobacter sp. A47]|uniref:UDP-3-O-(3-hydroxymyristoyl)glucosamine N-acyltransferase n=1 Tax=Acinetobacter sp. A47 TaxID=1561217 RepID=UPI00056FAC26|nr:UDP-3-O-(3-hydroxymyristoyl)glucosamine N-acyltransferase [Acinetobacter sp. A47]